MKLPKALLAKIVAHFDSLVAEGEQLLKAAVYVPPTRHEDMFGHASEIGGDYRQLDWSKFVEWRAKAATLLAHVIPNDSIHSKEVEAFTELQAAESELQKGISLLKAVKDDLQEGFRSEEHT